MRHAILIAALALTACGPKPDARLDKINRDIKAISKTLSQQGEPGQTGDLVTIYAEGTAPTHAITSPPSICDEQRQILALQWQVQARQEALSQRLTGTITPSILDNRMSLTEAGASVLEACPENSK